MGTTWGAKGGSGRVSGLCRHSGRGRCDMCPSPDKAQGSLRGQGRRAGTPPTLPRPTDVFGVVRRLLASSLGACGECGFALFAWLFFALHSPQHRAEPSNYSNTPDAW